MVWGTTLECLLLLKNLFALLKIKGEEFRAVVAHTLEGRGKGSL